MKSFFRSSSIFLSSNVFVVSLVPQVYTSAVNPVKITICDPAKSKSLNDYIIKRDLSDSPGEGILRQDGTFKENIIYDLSIVRDDTNKNILFMIHKEGALRFIFFYLDRKKVLEAEMSEYITPDFRYTIDDEEDVRKCEDKDVEYYKEHYKKDDKRFSGNLEARSEVFFKENESAIIDTIIGNMENKNNCTIY